MIQSLRLMFYLFLEENEETTRVAAVDEVLRSREESLALLPHNVQHDQQRMKKYVDLRRSERTLDIRLQVYLRWLEEV